MNDYAMALDSLKKARQVESIETESRHLDEEIRNVEQYLEAQRRPS
jgi:hypothetical protein